MSFFNTGDEISSSKRRQARKKVVSKLDDFMPSFDEGKNTKNTPPVRSALDSFGNIVSSAAKNLFKTKTTENSATEVIAGVTCGSTRRMNAAEDLVFKRAGLHDYQGSGKISCPGASSASKLAVGTLKQEEGSGGISENVLNDYLNVQYNIVFSMIPEGKTIKIQEAIPIDVDQKQRDLSRDLRAGQAIVLASTGGAFENDSVIVDINARSTNVARNNNIINGVGQPGTPFPLPAGITGSAGDITAQLNAIRSEPYAPQFESFDVSDRNYYAIQDLVIENFVAPTSSNPGISSMINGKMTIAEPGGFRLNDDIKSLGKLLGYDNVNIGRILYRLDISFSGYDPTTGRWKQVIDLDTRKGKSIPFLTYYVIITKVEAKVTNTGTVYEINIAPSGAGALRTEDFTTDAMATFSGSSNTFGDFLDNLQINLKKKRSEETTQGTTRPTGIIRDFEIIAPEPLRAATFYAEAWAVQKTFLKEGPGGVLISGGKDVDILTIINSALADLPFVHELFIAQTSEDDNKQFVRPRTHFTTRFNVIYGVPNAELGDYTNIKIQIIIEPFLSFKKGSYSAKTVADYTALGSQIRRVKQMESLGAIVRKYDYYNSSTNTEVIDFGINLSAFFTESVASSQDFPGTKGVGVASSAAQQEQNLQGSRAQAYAQAVQTQLATSLTGVSDNDDRFETRLTDGSLIETSANNGLTPYGVLGGGKSITPDQYSFGGTSSEAAVLAARKNRYMREFSDWLANDQQQIDNLQVRGDPLWLLSPYASSDMNRLQQISELIRPHSDVIIFINIKAPNQRDYANPENYNGSVRKSNPNTMGGFYGVSRITNSFSGGSFTQTIQGYKLNHLNYVEEGISFEDILGASIVNKSAVSNFTPGVSEVHENATSPVKKLYESINTATTPIASSNEDYPRADVLKDRKENN